jgi:hypothetical protein
MNSEKIMQDFRITLNLNPYSTKCLECDIIFKFNSKRHINEEFSQSQLCEKCQDKLFIPKYCINCKKLFKWSETPNKCLYCCNYLTELHKCLNCKHIFNYLIEYGPKYCSEDERGHFY